MTLIERGRGAWELLRQTFADWSEDKAPQLGASLAFYTALSIAPLLVILLGVAAFFFGDDAAGGHIVHELRALVGDEGAKAIEQMIASANKPTTGAVATVLSVATLLFGASGVFGQLQSALNTIWEVKPKPGRGARGFLRDRFLSFAMVMGMAFLLVVSLVITAGACRRFKFMERTRGVGRVARSGTEPLRIAWSPHRAIRNDVQIATGR